MLLLIDRTTESYYSLDCYEDMGYLAEKTNGNDFTATKVAETKFINLVEKYKSTETIIIEQNQVPTGEKNFEVYFISGVFLGNKLQKRVNDLSNLKSLMKIHIIDLSLNREFVTGASND